MSGGKGRQHSRSGPAGRQGARSGAGQLRPEEQSLADAAQTAESERQAFAGKGQFTGRDIPVRDPVEVASPASPAALDADGAGADVVPIAAYDELRDHLQRLAADFDNFRKRAVREREQAASAADARLLGELLVVLDDLERALGHSGEDASVSEGIRMVHGRLTDVLDRHGLTEVDTSGHFDPHLHEAMMMQPAGQGVVEGTIVDVVQKGYMLGDRVLRHARVIVAG